jgi:hypothetical protein
MEDQTIIVPVVDILTVEMRKGTRKEIHKALKNLAKNEPQLKFRWAMETDEDEKEWCKIIIQRPSCGTAYHIGYVFARVQVIDNHKRK